MTLEKQIVLKAAEGGDSKDDVYVPLNITRLIDWLITVEEAGRAKWREDADRRFIENLKKEVFGDA